MGKNRSIEAKRIKYLKQVKARPRVLRASPFMKASQGVDRSKIPLEYQGLFEYRQRAKGLIDPYLEALFPGSTMSEEKRQTFLDTITSERDHLMCVDLTPHSRLRKVLKRFNSRMNCIEFLEYHSIAKLMRISITYSNDDRAMDVFARGNITWKTSIQLGVEQDSA